MAHPPSHRSTQSISMNNLQPPTGPVQKQQRRMTSPTPSSSSLNLPEGQARHQQQPGRPPSPLRNTFVPNTFTGIAHGDDSEGSDDDDEEDHRQWRRRSSSPSSSVSQLAANFAQRVGSFVGGIGPRSPLPTDAELEADAERERDRSRREAERILTREAEERRLVEERVLALMESTKGLPPPPSRSQTMPNPPSPSGSQKEGGSWWSAAKNKLTPTKDKDPLTPAQQIIQETKSREKDNKKAGKGKEKEREWPANTQGKHNDPAFLNLNIPTPVPQRRPAPTSPSSPTPSRPSLSNMAPNLTPSPMRSVDGHATSPSREAPPLYAQFNSQGILDVPGTLLMIAKRFEKLEKWTVGHVRALEDRMSDVERWLVDKEEEKKAADKASPAEGKEALPSSDVDANKEIQEIRGEVSELQGRVGELGREMAKLATAPANLSSGPSRPPAPVSVAPQTTSTIAATVEPSIPGGLMTPHHSRLVSVTARESTSPPMTSSKTSGGTRLPYPTGDYATPPQTALLGQGTFSPTSSPPSSITSATRRSISGLPTLGLGISPGLSSASVSSGSSNSSGLPPPTSPPSARRAVSPSQGLPPPSSSNDRRTSVSPTPRKRYTVALGGPIVAPSDEEPLDYRRSRTPVSFSRPQSSIEMAFFSSSPGAATDNSDGSVSGHEDSGDEKEFQDETIGKSAAARLANSNNNNTGADGSEDKKTSSPSPSRIRAQSVYGFSSLQPPQTPVTPLRPRLRSRSTDRFASGESFGGSNKFVDPLVLRKQDKEAKLAMPKPIGKVPIGQLVAFFDGDKKA